jgi:hypothetical protein
MATKDLVVEVLALVKNIDSPPYTFFLLNDDMELNRNRKLLV